MLVRRHEQDERTGDRSAIFGVTAGVVTALAYVPGLDRSLTYDGAESVGFFVLADSPVDALKGQRAFNNHPLFSFIENLIVHAAGRSDEWLLRLFPIACAATAVGVLVWAVSRAAGTAAGLTAGVVMATNPMYVELGRAVRGYSLMVLVAVVATILHLRLLHGESTRHRLAYVIVAVIGLLTHFAIGPVFLWHAVDVCRRKMVTVRWLVMWGASGLLASISYAPMVDELLATGEQRGRIFRPWFPADLLQEVLGHAAPAVVILGVVAVYGLVRLDRDPTVRPLVFVTSAVVIGLWVAAPENLAPRFFLWLVPAIAVLAARTALDRPRLAVPAVLAAASSGVAGFAASYTDSVNRYPDVASVVEEQSAAGSTVCVTDLSVAPLLAYTRRFEALTDPAEAGRCDVVAIAEPSLDQRYIDELEAVFPFRIDLEARDPAVILSRAAIEQSVVER